MTVGGPAHLADDYVWAVELLAAGGSATVPGGTDGRGVLGAPVVEGTDLLALLRRRAHVDDAELVDDFCLRVSGGGAADVEARFVGFDGVTRWLWTRAAPRPPSGAEVDGISTNVTGRHRLADQRSALLAQERSLVERLRRLDRMKDQLVAVVSHELRTPLTAVGGYLELLLDDQGLSDSQRQHALAASSAAAGLRRLADDLLDVARLESGMPSLRRRPLDLAALTGEAVAAHRPAAVAAGLTVELRLGPVPPVDADAGRLRQVLDNLLSNAVKYTPAGGRVTVSTGADDDGAVVLTVSDTGVGVPEDERDNLFRPFFRASTATALGVPGTGLGLALSRAVAEAHGGSLTAAAGSPAGTVVTVRLPAG